MSRIVAAGLIVGLFLTPGLSASTEPSSSRGFSPDQVYHVNGIDTINDFTGNLTITIPIGPTYTTNGTLTYGFTLRYHNNMWDYRAGSTPPLDDPKPRWSSGGGLTDVFPAFDFNAGPGWRVSLGGHPKRHPIGLPGSFVDATGGEHSSFSSSSPVGTTNLGGPISFTNDSSYIRYHNDGSTRTAEYPDGTRERYICVAECAPFGVAWWDLDQRSDPYGNVLWVSRGPEPTANGGTWTWTYHEAVGSGPHPDHNNPGLTQIRTHTVVYTRDQRVQGRYRITSITLASAGPGGQALYTFDYTEKGIYRPRMHTPGLVGPTVPYTTDYPEYRMPLMLLTGITQPPNADGSSSGDWVFEYIEEPDSNDYPNDVLRTTLQNGTVWASSSFSGLLRQVTMPTAGKIAYKYGGRRLPKLFCEVDNPDERMRSFSATAVRERAVYDRQGNLDGGRPWKYLAGHFRGTGCNLAREKITATLDPFGNLDVSYFSIFMDGPNPGDVWKKHEWGLAVSKEEQDSAGRYLHTRKFKCSPTIFDGDSETATNSLRRLHQRYLQEGETLTCGNPIRTNWVEWESDSQYCRDTADCDQTNRRIKSTATSYHDDGNVFAETINDDYDGFGHYRQTRTGGNFYATNPGHTSAPGGDERITFTGFNPGVVFFNHGYVTLPNGRTLLNLDWVLNTFELKKTSQGRNGLAGAANRQTASMLYHFNSATGFLERQRTLRRSVDCSWNASTARADCYDPNTLDKADVWVEHTREQNGTSTAVTSAYYGGDNSPLSTSVDLSAPPVATPEYVIKRFHRYGGLEQVGYYDCGNETVLIVEENTIDQNTGLVLDSQSDAGALTSYTWDNLGRYKTIDPPGSDAAVSYTYHAATSSQPATVDAKVADGTLRTTTYEFDHLGRLTAEKNQVPTSATATTTSARFIEYLVTGWKSSESTVGPATPAAKTIYQDFDPFGRAKTVLHPDHMSGQPRKTTFQYIGERLVTETIEGLALPPGRGDSATAARNFDRFGRLVRVSESSGAGGAAAITKYEYDNLDHLILVSGPSGQRRRYSYDMRGFLGSETEPELGGRTVRHVHYDSRGNSRRWLLSRAREAATPFDMAMTYDSAERLTSVRQISTGRFLKTFTYFPRSGAPALSAGKLQKSIRNNWTPPPASPGGAAVNTSVTQEYTYDPSSGRVAARTTKAAGLTFATSFQYDGLGQINRITYPPLSGCAGCAPSRQVTFNYKEGKLLSIPSYATLISYAANGMPTTVTHSNGTVDQIDIDTANYMPRPKKIKTTFAGGATWDTGQYGYDAAGNVTAIGSTNTYTYDEVNRLVKASLSNGEVQNFSYDANGNLNLGAGMQPGVKTNRLPSPAAVYDDAGNLKSWTDPRDGSVALRDFDLFDQITHAHGGGQGKIHYYDANDQRVAVFDYAAMPGVLIETWSLRGLGDEVLRDFVRVGVPGQSNAPWSWRDYVYRSGTLLAEIKPSGSAQETLHVHVDHLGSTRRISNASGALVDSREYYPYGQEIGPHADENRIKFTGQERDAATTALGDLDYLHKRYYTPSMARFVSLDTVVGDPARPQSWNRYVYASNNPLSRIDPDGRADGPIVIGENIKLLRSSIASQGGRLNGSSIFAETRADRALVQFQNVLKADSVRNLGLDAARSGRMVSPEMFGELQADALRVGARTGNFSHAQNINKIGMASATELEAAGGASLMGKSIPVLGWIAYGLDVATVFLEEMEPIIEKENRAKPPRGGWEAYEFMLLLKKLQAEQAAKEEEERQRQQKRGTPR